MARVLTAKSVEAMRPDPAKRIELSDAAMPGLWLVVQPSGAKSWAYRYRFDGKPRKLTLGRYPALSLANARDEAGSAARKLELGTDPGTAKLAAKAEARVARETERDKVKTLIEQFDKRHLSQIKSGPQARQFLDRFVVKEWGERDVRSITKRDVLDLLDGIVDAGTPTTANRVLAHARKFFNWCIEREVLERAPTEGVRPPTREVSRDCVLSDDEIRWLWQASQVVGQPFGPLARVLLLTGQRLREVAGMTEHEIRGEVWHIPAPRTKNGRAHDVPLTDAVRGVLEGIKRVRGAEGLVFSTSGHTPVSGFNRGVIRLRAAMAQAAAAERGEPVDIPRWTYHDLRRTAAIGMARLGFPVHVVEAALNHKSGNVSGVAAIYNRHDYAAEKRHALEMWSRHVIELAGEAPAGGNVVARR